MASPDQPIHHSDNSASGAVDTVKQTAAEMREQAAGMAEQATQQAQSMLQGQKELAADRLENFADMLRDTADRLDQEAPGALAGYAQQAVSGLDNAAEALRTKSLDTLIADVEGFARRQPTLFLLGSVAAGFALARFLKSSGERRHEDGNAAGGYHRSPAVGQNGSPSSSSSSSQEDASHRRTGVNESGTAMRKESW